jgi:hypothetical protein
MSSIEVKEIVYHCECRRFAEGTPIDSCICPECGREHRPTDVSGNQSSGAAETSQAI